MTETGTPGGQEQAGPAEEQDEEEQNGEKPQNSQGPQNSDGLQNSQEPEGSISEEERISQAARKILEQMSLEEKTGQMFIARCPEEDAAAKAEQYHLGGYILFARDFEGKTKEQAVSAIQSYQSVSEIPMLIGVDEEGGTVTRISRYPEFREEPFPSPQELYREGGFEAVAEDTEEKCALLKSLGINVNFAPGLRCVGKSGGFYL